MKLTRRYKFCASHRLHAAALSDEENRAVYGKCNNPYGHGHDYVLEVCVKGPLDAETGRVVDVAVLDQLVSGGVLRDLDHKFLNVEVAEFTDVSPTTENLSLMVKNRLMAGWADTFPEGRPKLELVRIQETRRNTIEVRTD